MWVANQDDGTLGVLEPDGNPRRTIELGAAAAPYGVVTNPARDRVFVTLQGPGEVVAFDAASGAERARGKVGRLPAGIAVSADGSRVLVTSLISPQDRGEVHELDGATLANVRVHALALDPGPDGEGSSRGVPNYLRQVVISPDGATALLPSKKDNVLRGAARDGMALTFETSVRTIVSQLDLTNNVELLEQRLDFNNRALGLAAAYSPLGDYFFVAMLGSGGISMVDTYNGNSVGGLLKVAIGPDGLAIDRGGRLFVERLPVAQGDRDRRRPGAGRHRVRAAHAGRDRHHRHREARAGRAAREADLLRRRDPRMTRDGYISCACCHLDGVRGRAGLGLHRSRRGAAQHHQRCSAGAASARAACTGPRNFDEIQDFEHDIRNAFGGTGFMTDADFRPARANTTLGDPKAGVSAPSSTTWPRT